jgi:hypothetical protein
MLDVCLWRVACGGQKLAMGKQEAARRDRDTGVHVTE